MIIANFNTVDSNGKTAYPISIETLSLLQNQSLFIAQTFGAMFGRKNLILKIPTETEDGLCLSEGELIPIDYRASSYVSGGGGSYKVVLQTQEIPNFKEDIQIGDETFSRARTMTKAFIYPLETYQSEADFEASEKAQQVGVFLDGEEGYGICTLQDLNSDKYEDCYLDVTEFFNKLPQIYSNSLKDEESRFKQIEHTIKLLQSTDQIFNNNWIAYERESKERFGLLYALIINLYKSLTGVMGVNYDQYLDSKFLEQYGASAIMSQEETMKYLDEIRQNAKSNSIG